MAKTKIKKTRIMVADPKELYQQEVLEDLLKDYSRNEWAAIIQKDLIKRFGDNLDIHVATTGTGMWSNAMYAIRKEAITEIGNFYADEDGLVVAMKTTPDIENEFVSEDTALVEVASADPVTLRIDENDIWSIVHVYAGVKLVAHSYLDIADGDWED